MFTSGQTAAVCAPRHGCPSRRPVTISDQAQENREYVRWTRLRRDAAASPRTSRAKTVLTERYVGLLRLPRCRCGTAFTASGSPFSPSQTTISTSRVPRFLISESARICPRPVLPGYRQAVYGSYCS